jgi:hypothetical protein
LSNSNETGKAWFEMALAYGRRNGSFLEIVHGTEEHKSWAIYFGELGWWPVTFRAMSRDKTWTAPCRWPDSLPAFQPSVPFRRIREQMFEQPRPSPEQLDAQFARLGLSRLRPGSKAVRAGPGRHSADERREAQAVLDRYAAEARQPVQNEAAE